MEHDQPQIFYYQIGDRTYYQRHLGILQLHRVGPLLRGCEITEWNPWGLYQALKEKVLDLFLLCLIPEGVKIRDHLEALDNDGARAMRQQLEEDMGFLTIMKVLKDFFVCNQIDAAFLEGAGLLDLIAQSFQKMETEMEKIEGLVTIGKSFKPLPRSTRGETPRNGTTSGRSPQMTSSPTGSGEKENYSIKT